MLALYQPDIAANTAAMLRLAACFDQELQVIEPCGFVWERQKMQRAGMDYLELAQVRRHPDWASFLGWRGTRRLLLLTSQASQSYSQFRYRPDDLLLLGRESAGVPEPVAAACDARLVIPMAEGARCLNVGMAAAIVLAEAQRQLGRFG